MKIWTTDEIVTLIQSNDKAVAKAVIAIYNRQTADEKMIENTTHSNGVGFNASDVRYLSYIAKYCERNQALTGKHLDKARQKILKYRRQLVEIANENEKHRGEIRQSV